MTNLAKNKEKLSIALAAKEKAMLLAAEVVRIQKAIDTEAGKLPEITGKGEALASIRQRYEDAKAEKALGANNDQELKDLSRELSTVTAQESTANDYHQAKENADAIMAGLQRKLSAAKSSLDAAKTAQAGASRDFLFSEIERVGAEYSTAILAAEKALRQMDCLCREHKKWVGIVGGTAVGIVGGQRFNAPMFSIEGHKEVQARLPIPNQLGWRFEYEISGSWELRDAEIEAKRLAALGVDAAPRNLDEFRDQYSDT